MTVTAQDIANPLYAGWGGGNFETNTGSHDFHHATMPPASAEHWTGANAEALPMRDTHPSANSSRDSGSLLERNWTI